jgi:hypothetical protein
MASLEGDIEGAEGVLALALIVLIGYGLYKFSSSFACAVNKIIGNNTDPTCGPVDSNADPANTYAAAANQTVTNPGTTLGTIFGFNQTRTPTAEQSAQASTPVGTDGTQPVMIGSTSSW